LALAWIARLVKSRDFATLAFSVFSATVINRSSGIDALVQAMHRANWLFCVASLRPLSQILQG
jgi:hypothetical protein